ncbi:MAG TPA: response regulator transcription factor [Pyrinomonadaceae bacterium]|nr:response regulator transcription factor [Pyrinomonadaceae bacterium]
MVEGSLKMIFIVDDLKALRDRLVRMVSEVEGVEVVGQAQNAAEAIRGIRRLRPRVVVLDIQMPGGSGIEVLRTIKREAPPTIVVMLTNHTHAQYRQKCMELGADYFLDKTKDLDKLTEIFQDLVDQFRLKG